MNLLKSIIRAGIKASTQGLSTGSHITRYYMYQHLPQVFKNPLNSGKILSISGSQKLIQLFNLSHFDILEANYPEYNLLNLALPDQTFDYVISDQVLEHLAGDPQQAINESLRVLKPGGFAIHTTCFINPVHKEPEDFWRFTPDALAYLCRDFTKIIEVGGWGNPYVWLLDGLGLRYMGIPHATWHPLHKLAMLNQENWVIVTWIIAQK